MAAYICDAPLATFLLSSSTRDVRDTFPDPYAASLQESPPQPALLVLPGMICNYYSAMPPFSLGKAVTDNTFAFNLQPNRVIFRCAGKDTAPSGLPPPAWTGATTLTLPNRNSGGKAPRATVQLCTNVPPGDGGPVDWESRDLPSNHFGREGRWRGSLSVVKSALQVNLHGCDRMDSMSGRLPVDNCSQNVTRAYIHLMVSCLPTKSVKGL